MNIEIYNQIRNRILFLEYKSGEILNEKVLAGEFGVSRTPLREVLCRLEWEQLVRILPRSGTMVTEIEFHKMMNTFQVRLEIEAMVGRLAAEMITSSHLDSLEQLEKDCRALINQRNQKALAMIDFSFRSILHDAGKNIVLKDISNQLHSLTFRIWFVIMGHGEWTEEVWALTDEIRTTHEVLLRRNPIEVGDARKAALLRHVERIKRKFLEIPS
ncbi:GntR family transcriptional regulator [Desulforhopalus sp. IMCC35007]|uniref:GntR family transcriptional regulator n=1 Tax=Desulforhopalus sp. IMCC35007 TaxID=2569543 RepID=UPI0010ADE136|nr:GntR family transcriptional regulator [Desulforhopalus sp. IMCC35007]TKB08883.1 GntR family transcriptional regulator [Desulforhopalus sp. IMCC35007]